jgi:hypothetical protein
MWIHYAKVAGACREAWQSEWRSYLRTFNARTAAAALVSDKRILTIRLVLGAERDR